MKEISRYRELQETYTKKHTKNIKRKKNFLITTFISLGIAWFLATPFLQVEIIRGILSVVAIVGTGVGLLGRVLVDYYDSEILKKSYLGRLKSFLHREDVSVEVEELENQIFKQKPFEAKKHEIVEENRCLEQTTIDRKIKDIFGNILYLRELKKIYTEETCIGRFDQEENHLYVLDEEEMATDCDEREASFQKVKIN